MDFNLDVIFKEALKEDRTSQPGQGTLFDFITGRLENWFERPAGSIYEMKRRDNKQLKGLAWEKFCQWYLLKVLSYEEVWLWKDIPEDIKTKLKLTFRSDNGIDIIGKLNDKYIAIQCKYLCTKKNKYKKVTWKTISTFVGLVSRCGPFSQHIVMTNCSGVGKWDIPRSPKDKTIAYGTFKKLSWKDFTECKSLKDPNEKVEEIQETEEKTEIKKKVAKMKPISLEEMRKIRLEKLAKLDVGEKTN